MQDSRFEKFIKQLLDQADLSDYLRDISQNNSSLEFTVDNFLLQSQLESQFNPMGYDSVEKKNSVLSRLNKFKNLLDTYSGEIDRDHYTAVTAVELCISLVNNGMALNKDNLEYLNTLYRRYA